MTAPILYVTFPGNAREALEFYADVFGGEVELNTYAEMSNTDGPNDSIAHGVLSGGPVSMYGADAGSNESPVRMDGIQLSLLGTAGSDTLHRWFDRLAEGGLVVDPLAAKPWGASDGRVVDQFGIPWLVGYE